MMVAGTLTRVVPAGQYPRVQVDGRETIDPTSFQFTARPDYPVWRWFIAPIKVLGVEGRQAIKDILHAYKLLN